MGWDLRGGLRRGLRGPSLPDVAVSESILFLSIRRNTGERSTGLEEADHQLGDLENVTSLGHPPLLCETGSYQLR